MAPAAQTQGAPLVVFRLEGQRYGLDLERVERVLPQVALAPFPKAPAIVSGVFDLHGRLVPVVNVRRRFRLPERAPGVADQLLVVRSARRRLALAVDAVEPVVQVAAGELTAPEAVVPGLEFVRGIARLPALGIVFVHDLDRFLSLDEEAQLAESGLPA
jgi:purine-binding chemotaxis protein CheW